MATKTPVNAERRQYLVTLHQPLDVHDDDMAAYVAGAVAEMRGCRSPDDPIFSGLDGDTVSADPVPADFRTLDQLQQSVDLAKKKLLDAINRQFPVGCRVMAKWGRGWSFGNVSAAAWTGGDVIVRFDTGKVHHKHWREVQRIATE